MDTLTLHIPFILLGRHDRMHQERLDAQKLVETVHTVLLDACKKYPVPITLDDQDSREAAWLLQPQPTLTLEDDNNLSTKEKTHSDKNVWSCPMQLQRSNISLDTESSQWSDFGNQARKLFGELVRCFHDNDYHTEGQEGEMRLFNLVAGEHSWLRVSLVPGKKNSGILEPEVAKRVMTVFTAVERELTQLTTPPGLLKYWSFSRFLEYRGIRQLREEKDEMWKKLKDRKNITNKRKGTVYERDKKKWMSRFDEEDIACERTKGRKREWWDVVDCMDVEELLEEIRTFQETGRQLVVSCEFTEKKTMSSTERSTTYKYSGSMKANESNPVSQPLGPTQTGPSNANITASISTLTFNSYRSTLSISAILAHTELICRLVNLAYTQSSPKLAQWLEFFRKGTSPNPTQPQHNFKQLLSMLRASEDTKRHYKTELNKLFSEEASADNIIDTPRSLNLHRDPFVPTTQHIAKVLKEQRKYIPKFIERYTKAGGFYPTKGAKLYALMLKEELKRKKRGGKEEDRGGDGRGKETEKKIDDWRDRLGEVEIMEAKEPEEDLWVRARRSPGAVRDGEEYHERMALLGRD